MEEENERKRKIIIAKLKNQKIIRSFLCILIGLFPIAVILGVCIMAVNESTSNVFTSVTITGGDVYYGDTYEDLPKNITTDGIETWTDEQKSFFSNSKQEKLYYDNGFEEYNVINILKNKNEKYDIAIPIATAHYQGTVNQLAYDIKFEEDVKYNNDLIVSDSQTRNFFEQAASRVGSTFRIYPGNRMLMGNLIINNVTFNPVQYIVYDDGSNNSDEIYSDWNYLAKLTASSEEDAKYNYNTRNSINVNNAVSNIESAIRYGESNCQKNDIDHWEKINYCYDTESLYNEILGESFDINQKSVQAYLNEKYENFNGTDNARVPSTSLVNGKYYIAVNVTKSIDHKKYETYLKNVYIPFIYLDCENCSIDADESIRQMKINSIYSDIQGFINSFKYLNGEETFLHTDDAYYIDGGISSPASLGGKYQVPYEYTCENGMPNSQDYSNHCGIDLVVPENTLIYPLFSGRVTATANPNAARELSSCKATCDDGYCTCKNCSNGKGLDYSMGNYVAVTGTAADGKEHTIYYMHLNAYGPEIEVGATVNENTIIGYAGSTGCSTAVHMHIDFADSYSEDYLGLLRKEGKINGYKYAYCIRKGRQPYPPYAIYDMDSIKSIVCSR